MLVPIYSQGGTPLENIKTRGMIDWSTGFIILFHAGIGVRCILSLILQSFLSCAHSHNHKIQLYTGNTTNHRQWRYWRIVDRITQSDGRRCSDWCSLYGGERGYQVSAQTMGCTTDTRSSGWRTGGRRCTGGYHDTGYVLSMCFACRLCASVLRQLASRQNHFVALFIRTTLISRGCCFSSGLDIYYPQQSAAKRQQQWKQQWKS